MAHSITPTNTEVFFDDIIVSKTDPKGRLTYVNEVFCQVSGFHERELIGQPHSMIRHPDMPRAVFKLLWDQIQSGREIFAYVKNITKRGDFYWVFAHVTPSFDANGALVGYHSNRRVPERDTLTRSIVPLYDKLLREERAERNGKDALAAGFRTLTDFVRAQKVDYDELVFAL